jgi:hypothetical protein
MEKMWTYIRLATKILVLLAACIIAAQSTDAGGAPTLLLSWVFLAVGHGLIGVLLPAPRDPLG